MNDERTHAISITEEHLLTISRAARWLPRRDGGKHVHPSTIRRWIKRGVGGVRLEATKIGGSTYTSIEAIERFSARQAEIMDVGGEAQVEPTIEADLKALGILPNQLDVDHG